MRVAPFARVGHDLAVKWSTACTFGVALAVAVVLAGCGSSHRYTVSEVRQAFTRAGLHHPKVQTTPPGTIFNYGKPPHTVSVSIYSGEPPQVVFPKGLRGYRVTRTRNIMVYYSKTESGVVERALNLLK